MSKATKTIEQRMQEYAQRSINRAVRYSMHQTSDDNRVLKTIKYQSKSRDINRANDAIDAGKRYWTQLRNRPKFDITAGMSELELQAYKAKLQIDFEDAITARDNAPLHLKANLHNKCKSIAQRAAVVGISLDYEVPKEALESWKLARNSYNNQQYQQSKAA